MNTYYKPHSKRNLQIIEARLLGKTWKKLGEEFNLSPITCRKIVDRYIAEIKAIEASIGKHDFYAALCEVMKYIDNSSPNKIFNILWRAKIAQKLNDDIFALDKYTDEDLLRLRNIGEKSLKIIREANELYKSWHMEDSNENHKEN